MLLIDDETSSDDEPRELPIPVDVALSPPPVTDRPAEPSLATKVQYFEFHDEKSHKFWEISVQGSRHTVRLGRIGTKGQSQSKTFADQPAAERDAQRLIHEKTGTGYAETKAGA